MNKSTLILSLGVAVLGFSAFTNVSDETAKSPTTKSIINWTATKVVGGGHTGTIEIKETNLKFSKGVLKGGSITADMTTIADNDLDGEWNAKLVGHLNSDDFFSTAKYPTSIIKIKKVTKGSKVNSYNIVADLTIKGITNSESFTATVVEKGGNYIVTANVNIDRTKYNVRYGSPSFFDDLGDKAISDEFSLNVTVVTAK
jgi:polyisoprenoid-binding protein YceI